MFDLRDLYSITKLSDSIFVTRYGVDWTRYILSVISQHYEYSEWSRDHVRDHDVAPPVLLYHKQPMGVFWVPKTIVGGLDATRAGS